MQQHDRIIELCRCIINSEKFTDVPFYYSAYIFSQDQEHPEHIYFNYIKQHGSKYSVFAVFKNMTATYFSNTSLYDFYIVKTSYLEDISLITLDIIKKYSCHKCTFNNLQECLERLNQEDNSKHEKQSSYLHQSIYKPSD